jgi:hypothetical protein
MAVPKRKEVPTLDLSSVDAFQKTFSALLDDVQKNPDKYDFLTEGVVGNPISLGPRVISPEDWAAKQTSRASAAAADWEKNVTRPRKNPVEAALKADAKRKDRLAEAEKQDKWKKKMAKVDLDEMFTTIKNVGASGYAAGIAARTHKVARVAKELQPMVAALAASIDAMPDGTDAQRAQRLLAARAGMLEIGKKRAG